MSAEVRAGDVLISEDGPVVTATIDRPEARNAISRAPGAIPAMPMPLSALAAITPATAVPCRSGPEGRLGTKS